MVIEHSMNYNIWASSRQETLSYIPSRTSWQWNSGPSPLLRAAHRNRTDPSECRRACLSYDQFNLQQTDSYAKWVWIRHNPGWIPSSLRTSSGTACRPHQQPTRATGQRTARWFGRLFITQHPEEQWSDHIRTEHYLVVRDWAVIYWRKSRNAAEERLMNFI